MEPDRTDTEPYAATAPVTPRIRQADAREAAADRRDLLAGRREHLADAREDAADQRDLLADAREDVADQREHAADAREVADDAREAQMAAWESRLDVRSRALHDTVPSHRQRSYEAIQRSRRLMHASQDRLARSEAALQRADTRDAWEQLAVIRQMTTPGARQQDGTSPRQAAEASVRHLHEQLMTVTAALAAAQDTLADEYDRLALQQPEHATDLRRRSEHARLTALRLRTAPPPDPALTDPDT
ncbi:hypothetical protein OKJ48_00065 [Streptomyces kunmingensis]|uniref:Uncharacterized protein n=1 Tax=Streptomyces kunmingensis TaxID=68225 RepID=A0ABU6C1Q8_9ACTN|nr:hypothetical protein [Streptomyces kunmingensis]MEB3958664.1 hypothetical protein [Streptomyces kunmingensis]